MIFERYKKEHGFTLIEVMAALTILSGAFVALMLTVRYSLNQIMLSKQITQATFLAQQKAEELESRFAIEGFASIQDGQKNKQKFPSPNEQYSYEVQIERVQTENLIQSIQQLRALQQAGDLGGAAISSSSNGGAMLDAIVGKIDPILKEALRRISVKVFFVGPRKKQESVEVIFYYIDLKEVS